MTGAGRGASTASGGSSCIVRLLDLTEDERDTGVLGRITVWGEEGVRLTGVGARLGVAGRDVVREGTGACRSGGTALLSSMGNRRGFSESID